MAAVTTPAPHGCGKASDAAIQAWDRGTHCSSRAAFATAEASALPLFTAAAHWSLPLFKVFTANLMQRWGVAQPLMRSGQL